MVIPIQRKLREQWAVVRSRRPADLRPHDVPPRVVEDVIDPPNRKPGRKRIPPAPPPPAMRVLEVLPQHRIRPASRRIVEVAREQNGSFELVDGRHYVA